MLSYYINRSSSRGLWKNIERYVELCENPLLHEFENIRATWVDGIYAISILRSNNRTNLIVDGQYHKIYFRKAEKCLTLLIFLYISVIDEISSISPSKICVIDISKRWISIDDNRRNLRLGCPDDLHILPTYSSGFSVSDFSYSFCSGSKLGSSS